MSAGTHYAVGQPYISGKTHWPESVEYNYRAGAHELQLFYNTPSNTEIESVQNGLARFAIWPYRQVLFFCFKFGDMHWSDSVFSWWHVNEEDRQLPPDVHRANERAILFTLLIDAKTGLIQAIRACTFSPRFTRMLHVAIWDQAHNPMPDIEAVGRYVYGRYNSATIAYKRAIVSCRGGD